MKTMNKQMEYSSEETAELSQVCFFSSLFSFYKYFLKLLNIVQKEHRNGLPGKTLNKICCNRIRFP